MDYVISFLQSLSKYGTTTRIVVKYILRSITGQCELERICKWNKHGYKECQDFEFSLYHSKHGDIRRLLVTDSIKVKNAVQTVLRIKRIVPEKDLHFLSSLTTFFRKIISYNILLSEVDEIRNTPYDEENKEHETLLEKFWLSVMEEPISERYSKDWGDIGFQGTNPATDFRGMGILSLKNLIFLMENYKDIGLKIYGLSKHPDYWFPFAVAGINMTSVSFELLRDSSLKGYFYNQEDLPDYSLVTYQKVFVEIFYEFIMYWINSEPSSIMLFNQVKDEFKEKVRSQLRQGTWTPTNKNL